MSVCANCDEQEHDCCLNLLRPGTCPCTCPADGNDAQPPMSALAMFVVVGSRPPRHPGPPWPPGFYCGDHHLIDGDNAYYDRHQRRWFCRRCRQASWRRSKQRRRDDGEQVA